MPCAPARAWPRSRAASPGRVSSRRAVVDGPSGSARGPVLMRSVRIPRHPIPRFPQSVPFLNFLFSYHRSIISHIRIQRCRNRYSHLHQLSLQVARSSSISLPSTHVPRNVHPVSVAFTQVCAASGSPTSQNTPEGRIPTDEPWLPHRTDWTTAGP